jgi:hypothetical protein
LTHQLLLYSDDANLPGDNIKRNTEILIEASKEAGLEVNAKKKMYVFVFSMIENTTLRKTLEEKEPVGKWVKWSFLACGVFISIYIRELLV